MGEFFEIPSKEEHHCFLPEIPWQMPLGQGWRCDCGKAYVLESVSQHGESWKQWKRLPSEDR